MAYEIQEGFIGNLTADQEVKLRQLWKTVFKLYDMYESKDPELQEAIKNCAKKAEAPAKSRFSLWRTESQGTTQSSDIIEKYLDLGSTTDANKVELRKKFVQMLAVYDAESVRAMVIEAVKGDHPDTLVLRFLRARKWEVDAALVMMIFAMDWRYHEAKVDSDVMRHGDYQAAEDEKTSTDANTKTVAKDFMRQIRMGKGYLHGVDRQNRPISCVRVKMHKPFDQKVESLERFIIYLIETGRFTLVPPVETACLIFDLSGFTLANMDYVPLKFIIKCFEANYPESLGIILVHNAPWVFNSIWKVIRGLLDPVVAGKVNFTYGREGLEKFIAPDQLIKELGGDEDWEYEYVEPVAGENDIMKDTIGKAAVMKERNEIAEKFEAVTRKWVDTEAGPEADEMFNERNRLAALARTNYWKLDPFVRARSMYDRQGIIRGGVDVDWYSKKGADVSTTTETKAASANGATVDTVEDVFVDAAPTNGIEKLALSDNKIPVS